MSCWTGLGPSGEGREAPRWGFSSVRPNRHPSSPIVCALAHPVSFYALHDFISACIKPFLILSPALHKSLAAHTTVLRRRSWRGEERTKVDEGCAAKVSDFLTIVSSSKSVAFYQSEMPERGENGTVAECKLPTVPVTEEDPNIQTLSPRNPFCSSSTSIPHHSAPSGCFRLSTDSLARSIPANTAAAAAAAAASGPRCCSCCCVRVVLCCGARPLTRRSAA